MKHLIKYLSLACARKPANTTRSASLLVWVGSLLAITSQPLSAQTEEEVATLYFKDWYQVELVIFERIQEASADPESWPKNISLAYPPKLTFFREEKDLSTTRVGENASEQVGQDNRAFLEQLRNSNPNDPLNKKVIDAITNAEQARITPAEQPYTPLKTELRMLNKEAKLLGRDRYTRILFHEVWRQPIVNQKNAPSIVISGGDLFDKNHELEGSISLYVSRYLHIHTNLWLTDFEANFGQDLGHWPILPIPPTYVNVDAVENLLSSQQPAPANEWNVKFGQQNIDLNSDSANSNLLIGFNASEEQRPYVARNIVTMKQKRRMRSGELHYIDHPKLGILVIVNKYVPASLQESK